MKRSLFVMQSVQLLWWQKTFVPERTCYAAGTSVNETNTWWTMNWNDTEINPLFVYCIPATNRYSIFLLYLRQSLRDNIVCSEHWKEIQPLQLWAGGYEYNPIGQRFLSFSYSFIDKRYLTNNAPLQLLMKITWKRICKVHMVRSTSLAFIDEGKDV